MIEEHMELLVWLSLENTICCIIWFLLSYGHTLSLNSLIPKMVIIPSKVFKLSCVIISPRLKGKKKQFWICPFPFLKEHPVFSMLSLFCLLCAKLLFHICEKKVGIKSIWTKLLAKAMLELAIEKIRFPRNFSSSVQHPQTKKVCV